MPDNRDSESLSNRSFCIGLLLIVTLGIGLRFWHSTLNYGDDDQTYILAARQLTQQVPFDIPTHFRARIIWLSILRVWGHFFGLRLESVAILMYFSAAISMVLVGLIGAMLSGRCVGLAAAAIYSAFPVNVRWDVVVFPDGIAVLLFLASLACFHWFEQKRNLSIIFVAGFMSGIVFSIKSYYAIVAFAVFVGLLHMYSSNRRRLVLSSFTLWGAFLIGFSFNPILQYLATGNPWYHFVLLSEYGERYSTSQHQQPSVVSLAKRALFYPRTLLSMPYDVVGVLMAVGTFYFVVFKQQTSATLSTIALMVFSFLFLSFFPSSISPFVFVEAQERYLVILTPLLSIAAATLVVDAYQKVPQHFLRRCVLIGFFLALVCGGDAAKIKDSITLEMIAIDDILESAESRGFDVLVLPWDYGLKIADRTYEHDVQVIFAVPPSRNEDRRYHRFGTVPDHLFEQSNVAVFMGTRHIDDQISENQRVQERLRDYSFRATLVKMPETSTRLWLRYFGKKPQGTPRVVGKLFLHTSDNTEKP